MRRAQTEQNGKSKNVLRVGKCALMSGADDPFGTKTGEGRLSDRRAGQTGRASESNLPPRYDATNATTCQPTGGALA